MTDFSSNHFQKAQAKLMVSQDDRCKGCATIDIDGGATTGV